MTSDVHEPAVDGVSLAERSRELLPAKAYTSAAFYQAELKHVFERSWVHVADLPELARAGDYVTSRIGRAEVLVVRDEQGVLRGFINACRHRGATLAEGSGNCGKHLRCPYHAWTYTTDGKLIGVPFREEFAGRLEGVALIPIRVATAGPLVFGCLDETAPPFEQWAGGLLAALAEFDAAAMVPAFEYTYDVAVNWKVYVENALDGYHVQFVHDLLPGVLGSTREVENTNEVYGSASTIPLAPGLVSGLMAANGAGPARIRFGNLLPNLIPVISPLELTYLRIDPAGPERTRLVARSFDHGGSAEHTRALRRAAADRTVLQDIAVVERVQRGLAGERVPPFVYAEHLEQRIGHFERMLLRELRNGLAGELLQLRRAG